MKLVEVTANTLFSPKQSQRVPNRAAVARGSQAFLWAMVWGMFTGYEPTVNHCSPERR